MVKQLKSTGGLVKGEKHAVEAKNTNKRQENFPRIHFNICRAVAVWKKLQRLRCSPHRQASYTSQGTAATKIWFMHIKMQTFNPAPQS